MQNKKTRARERKVKTVTIMATLTDPPGWTYPCLGNTSVGCVQWLMQACLYNACAPHLCVNVCVLIETRWSLQTHTLSLSDTPSLSWIIQKALSPNSSNSYSFICIPGALQNDWPAITTGKKKEEKKEKGREKCSPNNLLQNETGMILFFSTAETGPCA